LGKQTLPHLHVNVAVYYAQMLKIFARIMANFSALGMRPHPLHPYAVRLCVRPSTLGREIIHFYIINLPFLLDRINAIIYCFIR